MSNQISRIRVTAKKNLQLEQTFFDALLFFLRPSISSLLNKKCMVGSIHLRGEREVGSKRDFFFLMCQPFASLRFKNLSTKRCSVITAHRLHQTGSDQSRAALWVVH